MVEVVDKEGTDRGGIPVHAAGCLQVLEEFRLPEGFDPNAVRVFNTNTLHVHARRILEVPLPWNLCQVAKKSTERVLRLFERSGEDVTESRRSDHRRVRCQDARTRGGAGELRTSRAVDGRALVGRLAGVPLLPRCTRWSSRCGAYLGGEARYARGHVVRTVVRRGALDERRRRR